MKKIIFIPFILGAMSCNNIEKIKEEKIKDYVTLSGKITNIKEGDLTISAYFNSYIKVISIKEDGSFEDTLKVPDSIVNYQFSYGGNYGNLFLLNGDKLSFTLDTENFEESLSFEGDGVDENFFLTKQEDVNFMELIAAENLNFENELNAEIQKKQALLNQNLDLNQKLIASEKKSIENFRKGARQYHNQSVEKARVATNLIGNPSPSFENYTTPKDELISLDQFKGRYTYIDIWATWCGPCKAEIPSIIEFMATNDSKKMNIVSISVDDEKNTDSWKNMILEKNMDWPQLKADSAWDSKFIKAYAINSIPRFILLDPEGNVVNPDAPRPSSEDFKTMIEGLNL